MKKLFIVFTVFISLFILSKDVCYAQNSQELIISVPQDYYVGSVSKVIDQIESEDDSMIIQKLSVKIDNSDKTEVIEYIYRPEFNIGHKLYKVGDRVVVARDNDIEEKLYIYDQYRIFPMLVIFAIFAFTVFIFAGFRGLTALTGLLISILVIYNYIVPEIIAGKSPIIVGMIGTFVVAVLSIYTSHGLNKRTSIALLSTVITLGIAILFSMFFVSFSNLFGIGQEDALLLQAGSGNFFDLRGLLLCGIIIGTLGVLDDVTTAQVATVDEIRKANFKLSKLELYKRGLSVGREHILAMVNTLVMAYVGVSLPLFLLFYMNQDRPFWVILNSEFIAEEIVRTLAGSLALVLAVPIATFLASYVLPRKINDKEIKSACGHSHY